MDGWLATIVSLICSTIITTTIGLIIKTYFSRLLAKKEKAAQDRQVKEEEYEKLREDRIRRERKADVMNCTAEVVKPLADKIDKLDQKLGTVEDGTLSTLRNDILTCYYRCVEKGYRNDYDYQNIHHMHESYAELHGNSYVKDIMDRFDELPTKEELKVLEAKGKKNKKKAIV